MPEPKTIFITGASSGIGLASAKLFYEKGWNVVATMRSPEKDVELKKLEPERIVVLRLDLQDIGTIQPALDTAIAKFGKIDVLVNNAGYSQNGLLETIPREKIQAQFDVNVFGPMEMIRAILPHFRENREGGIINVSSGGGLFALPLISMYNASKFALEGFTESLSYELASQNIFVKSVIPYGGVSSTNFGVRATQDIPTVSPPTSYGPFLASTMQKYQQMIAEISLTSQDVALNVYEAATDGKDNLRYLIGPDERGFIKARYESKTDEEYMSHMREFFK